MSGPESTKTQLSTDQSRDACRVYFIQQCHSLACSGHKTGIKAGLEQCFEHRSKPKGLIELIFPVWREISDSMSRTSRKISKLSFDQKQKLWALENPQRPLSFKEKKSDALSFSISAAFCVTRIRTRNFENGLISSRWIGPNA